MNKVKNIIIISLIFLILTGLCVFFGYKYIELRNKPPKIIKSTTVEYKYDTLRHTDSLWFPDPVYIEKHVYPDVIDTPATIEDYFTGKIYEYNYKDTNIKFHAGIMLHKNSLVYFIPDYEIYRKTTTITNNIEVIKPPKFSLAIGGDIGALIDSTRLKPLFFITASIQKEKSIYEFGYDPFNKVVKFGYKYTIYYNKKPE